MSSQVAGPTVLVSGGAGFIGTALAGRLIARDCRVVAMDSLHPQVHRQAGGRPPALPHEVELLPADVSHAPDWQAVLRLVRPDVIVHLAAETGTGQSLTEATRHGTTNVIGTTQLIDALHQTGHRPQHILLASSRAVYGEGEWLSATGVRFSPGLRSHAALAAGQWDPGGPDGSPARPLSSSAGVTAANPTTVYGATKLAQENILSAWAAATGTSLSILRLQNVYGPGQSLQNAYTGVITLFARLALEGKVIEVYEDGQMRRDLVFIEDVVAAFDAAMLAPEGRRLVDVGSGKAVNLLEVATQLAAACGAPPPQVSGRFRDGDIRAASCTIAAAHEDLGWWPQTSLSDGLAQLLAWITSVRTG